MSYASTNILIIGKTMPGYHTKKDGTKAKKGLYYNMNKKKAAGTSNSKAKSTVSAKSYKSMLGGFKK
jgi:hypothetical protein